MTYNRPWHLWLVGTVSLIWNVIGAADYVMTHAQNASYMESFNAAQLEYFYNLPSWLIAAWATAVWTGVLGSILLLSTKKVSAPVFLVSLIALSITDIYSYMVSNAYDIMGGKPTSLVLPFAIFIIAVSLYCYAKKMSINGVLQ